MRFRLFINCAATGWTFGMWQWHPLPWAAACWAGMFMFLLMGFVLSAIDYAHHKTEIGNGR